MVEKQTNKDSEIKQLVTFELEDSIFGMDIMVAQENLKFEDIRPVPNSPSYFEGFKNLRGKIIPIINFKKLFSFSKFDMEKQKYIIIIEIEDSQFGIVVDKVLRVVSYKESDVKDVRSRYDDKMRDYIYGVIESEKELISILDMKAIFNYADKTLLIGSDDDDYVLKHKRDKTIYVNFNRDTWKKISHSMNKIGLPVNNTTEWSIRRAIAKIVTTKNLPLSTTLNYIESLVKESPHYTNFNKNGDKIFFDLDDDYRAIQKLITNVLVPKKENLKKQVIRLWNIGCDNGTEAYSIAFLIKNYINNYFNWDINILSSGEDYDLLTKASKGVYPKSYFRRFYVRNFEEFLESDEEKEMKKLEEFGEDITIIDEIRQMIDFDMRNIITSKPISCDFIIARNYLTNLTEEEVEKVVKIFSDSLEKGGILMLSEVEGIEKYTRDFVQKEINNRSYYVKI